MSSFVCIYVRVRTVHEEKVMKYFVPNLTHRLEPTHVLSAPLRHVEDIPGTRGID